MCAKKYFWLFLLRGEYYFIFNPFMIPFVAISIKPEIAQLYLAVMDDVF
jgi:hypothetical protein